MRISAKKCRLSWFAIACRSLLHTSLILSLLGQHLWTPLAAEAGWGNGAASKSPKQPPSVQRMISIAGQFEKQGAYARAAALYQKILQRHPGHLHAQKRLDLCQAELERGTPIEEKDVSPIPTVAQSDRNPDVDLRDNSGSISPVTPAIPLPSNVNSPEMPQREEIPVPPEVLPLPSREVTEYRPTLAPAANISIPDDEWETSSAQQVPPRPDQSDDIPRLGDEIDEPAMPDEPEMLSVTTQPTALQPMLPVPGDVPAIIQPSNSESGPRLSLKKLETRLSVDPRSLSASAGAVTRVTPASDFDRLTSPYVAAKPYVGSESDIGPAERTLSAQDEEIPHIGRVALSEDEDDSPGRAVVPPESGQPALHEQPIPGKQDSSSSKSPSKRDYSNELMDETRSDGLTPGYRTGLISVCPRATQEIRRLIRSMETPNVRVRKTSLLRLCNLSGDARSALPAVRELLFDPDESIRVIGAYSLWHIGQDPSGMLTLTDVVVTGSPENSCLAAFALGEIGPSAAEASPLLEHIAANGTGLMRLHAWEAVWRINQGNDRALEGLRSFLKEGDVHERWLATYMLGNSGAKRLDMIHDLCEALDDSSTIVRTGAGFALGCIGPDASMATPRLISIFETSEFDDALRVTAFEALSEIEPLTAAQFRKTAHSRIRPVGRTTTE